MKQLYQQLLSLADDPELSFYYKDHYLDEIRYRIFNYHLASYTEFQKDSASECRGIMFEVDSKGNYLAIKCRPMVKFWNYSEIQGRAESGLGKAINLKEVIGIYEKADGSLISSYQHRCNTLRLKSKGSLSSEQANDSWLYITDTDHTDLYELVMMLLEHSYTTNFEWCSPDNRIVLSYPEPKLKLLNIRHMYTGEYLPYDDPLLSEFQEVIDKHKVESFLPEDPEEFILSVPGMSESIEGFIAELKGGTFFKVKTSAYLALHHTKDSVNSPRRLFECVLEEVTDDIKDMFAGDLIVIKMINDMESFVAREMNLLISNVETYHKENKDLERKDYAINGKKVLSSLEFGLAMQLYIGREVSYKEVMKKNWKTFGIKDSE